MNGTTWLDCICLCGWYQGRYLVNGSLMQLFGVNAFSLVYGVRACTLEDCSLCTTISRGSLLDLQNILLYMEEALAYEALGKNLRATKRLTRTNNELDRTGSYSRGKFTNELFEILSGDSVDSIVVGNAPFRLRTLWKLVKIPKNGWSCSWISVGITSHSLFDYHPHLVPIWGFATKQSIAHSFTCRNAILWIYFICQPE